MIQKRSNIFWFSLIEILVGILIISTIILIWFQVLSSVGVGKVKLIEKTQIEKQAYFSSEKLFEMIKKGWKIDYEEYWNRYNYDTSYSSGHFDSQDGFGNYGRGWVLWGGSGYGPYYCISKDGIQMGTGWCLRDFNTNSKLTSLYQDNLWEYQRYGEYKHQFIDYNSDADDDQWNEDGSLESTGAFINDADDLYLWIGPEAFPSGIDIGELYLIDSQGKERTFFRWNVIQDPYAPPTATCIGTKNMTGSGCLGSIEFLKLVWRDYWIDHQNNGWYWDEDGLIDTWLIHPDFLTGAVDVLADSNDANYWQSIFPDSINVSNVEFYLYPNTDPEYSWRDNNTSLQISPYLRLKMTLEASWKNKRKIKWKTPKIDIATTIHLTDLDFQ